MRVMGLFADQDDPASEAGVTHGNGGMRSGLTGADDEVRCHHLFFPLAPPPATTSGSYGIIRLRIRVRDRW